MSEKGTNILMVLIATVVFAVLTYSVVINTDKEVTVKIIEAFLILASNICTFFFTKHQINSNKADKVLEIDKIEKTL